MKTATTKIGNIEISVDSVTLKGTTKDDGNVWIFGTASIEWVGEQGGCDYRHTVEIPVGCWIDTDDDNAEWAAWHEGARAIERCLGGSGNGDMRGTAVQFAFRDESESLGSELCEMLRAEYQS